MGPKPRELDQPENGGGVPLADAPGKARPPERVALLEKVGFGLRGLAEFLRRPADARGCHLAPGDITLIFEDGLLMALGPDGDPVPPGSFAAAAALLPDQEVAWRGGPPLAAHRVAAVLEAQAAARQRGEPMAKAWLLAMLGVGSQPDPAPQVWLHAEQLYCDLTAIGDELLVSPNGGEAFLITDAKGEAFPEDDASGISIGGRSLSAAGLADRVRAHVLSRGEGPVEAEMVLSDCTLGLHHQMLVLRTPFADVELRQDPSSDAAPAVRIFLADGRPVGPGALAVTLGHPSRAEEPSEQPTRADFVQSCTETRGETAQEQKIGGPGAGPVEPTVQPDAPSRTSAPTGRTEMIHLPLQPPGPPGGAGTAVVRLAGLPAGATLSAGFADGDGGWSLQPQELADLTLALPSDGPEVFSLDVIAISVLDRDGALASASERVTVVRGTRPAALRRDRMMPKQGSERVDALVLRDLPPGARLSAGTHDPVVRSEVITVARGAVSAPLHLDRLLPQQGGERVDALVLRDLPPGARLSAGTHDPVIRGWIVLPTQVPGLALMRSAAQTGASQVRVHGLTLQSAGQAAATELAKLFVIIA